MKKIVLCLLLITSAGHAEEPFAKAMGFGRVYLKDGSQASGSSFECYTAGVLMTGLTKAFYPWTSVDRVEGIN
jgi:hypothetical protein